MHSLSHLSEIASYANAYCVIGINDSLRANSRYTFGGWETGFVEWRPTKLLTPKQVEVQSKRIAACLAHAKLMSSGWN